MTPIDLEGLRALLERATPGEHVADIDMPANRHPRVHAGSRLVAVFGNMEIGAEDRWETDAALYAALRNAAPALLALADRAQVLQGECERLQREYEAVSDDHGELLEKGIAQAEEIARLRRGLEEPVATLIALVELHCGNDPGPKSAIDAVMAALHPLPPPALRSAAQPAAERADALQREIDEALMLTEGCSSLKQMAAACIAGAYAAAQLEARWRPISEADKSIAVEHNFPGMTIRHSYPSWVRIQGGEPFEAVWSDQGYWWALEAEAPCEPDEFMPHPLAIPTAGAAERAPHGEDGGAEL